jgi:Protein of unknown function (DUF992)
MRISVVHSRLSTSHVGVEFEPREVEETMDLLTSGPSQMCARTNRRAGPSRFMPAATKLLRLAALGLVASAANTQVAHARGVTQVGTLVCRMGPRIGAVVGSRQRLDCRYTQSKGGPAEAYAGTITRFGLDVGVTTRGVMTWKVLTRTRGHRHAALAGHYFGVSGDASLGVGVGAKVLIGGSRRAFVLQPVSLVGKVGVNAAVGVTGLALRFVGAPSGGTAEAWPREEASEQGAPGGPVKGNGRSGDKSFTESAGV